MGSKRIIGVAVAFAVFLAAGACRSESAPVSAPRDSPASAGVSSGDTPGPLWPAPHYNVGIRTIELSRGADRPLTTLVFYPTAPGPAANRAAVLPSAYKNRDHRRLLKRRAERNRRARIQFFEARRSGNTWPAPGRFPLVLFSHGLHGSPVLYSPALVSWAAAGFVIAAPIYPHTSAESAPFDRADIVNQPADALYVLEQIRALDSSPGDPLAGHVDVDRVAAVGHSAGGFTTTGLFVAGHPAWLRAGVVLAGWLAPGAFGGPAATMLYLQGERDNVVPVALGKAAYDATPWWKSYVLLPNSWHADYMVPTGKNFPMMDATVTDFLRWTMDGDEAAHRRLPPSSFPAGPAE